MRYHTTFKDIVVSVVVLLACVCICLYGMLFFSVINPAQPFSNYLISRLDSGNNISLSVGSLQRPFLREIILDSVTLNLQDEQPLTLERLSLDKGVGQLLLSMIKGGTHVTVQLDSPHLNLSLAQFEQLGSSSRGQTTSLLTSWLDKNSFGIKATSLNADFVAPSTSASLREADIEVDFDNGLSFAAWNLRADSLSLHSQELDLCLKDLLSEADSFFTATFDASEGRVVYQDTTASFEQLELIGHTPSQDISLGDFDFDFSLFNFSLNDTILAASIPKLSAKLSLDHYTISSLEASYDSLELGFQDYWLHSPTATLNVRQDDPLLLISFATKVGSDLTLQKDGYHPLTMLNLAGSAQLDEKDTILARLSFQDAQTVIGETVLTLEKADAFVASELQAGVFDSLSLSLDADISALFGSSAISLSSPLEANLHLTHGFSSFSSTLSLPALRSELVEDVFSGSLAYQQNPEGGQFQASLGHTDQFLLNILYDLPTHEQGTFSIVSRLQEFPIALARPTLIRFAPFLTPYYSDTTRLTGNLSFQSMRGTGTTLGFDGIFASDLILRDAALGNRKLDAGLSILSRIEGEAVLVDSLSLFTSDFRLTFEGGTELNYWLPSGDLFLFDTKDGSELVSMSFSPIPPNQYHYQFSTPLMPSLSFAGVIARDGLEHLIGTADLVMKDQTYPLEFVFSLPTLHLELRSLDNLSIEANIAPPFYAAIKANNLVTPSQGLFNQTLVDGKVLLEFNTIDDWKMEAENIELKPLYFNNFAYGLQGSLYAYPFLVTSKNLILTQEASTYALSLTYRGESLIRTFLQEGLSRYTFNFDLSHEGMSKIGISLLGSTERIESLVTLHNLSLDTLVPVMQGSILDFTAYGYTDFKQRVSMDGTLSLFNPEFTFAADVSATDSILSIERGAFERGTFQLQNLGLSIDAQKGLLLSSGRFEHLRALSYTDQLSHGDIVVSIPFNAPGSLFNMNKVITSLPKDGIAGELSVTDFLFLDEKGIADGTYAFNFNPTSYSVESPLLDVFYAHRTGDLALRIDREFGFGLQAHGWIRSNDLNVVVDSVELPLVMLNRLFVKPVFGFIDGTARGEVIIGGTLAKPKTYGQLTLDSSSMFVFWLPEDIISVKGVTVTLDGTRAISPNFPFFSTNRTTGVTVRGIGLARADFDGLSLESYEIEATTLDGQIFTFLPMQGFDAEVSTYAEGNFKLFGIGYQTWLSGDIFVENTSMSLGVSELPFWYEPTNVTSTNFNITTGKNVSFFYPTPINPFIKATLTEGQRIDITYNHLTDLMTLDGNFTFRSGEIYYFQKNFFITEGSLNLHTDALTGSPSIQPKINLRAKLSDFDNLGNRVDIFLILRDASLHNLNPQFESIPNKDINEIMSIMGQSILPSGAYGQMNLYSVASLAAAATDVAGRLGYFNAATNSTLTEAIRISLGLDLFSLRSNVVQNILFDALPGNPQGSSFSPLARYLNNTTMFMGKYIGKNYFLQALVHLSAADKSRVKRSFVAPDLSIDLELSMEWTNPLGTFSFFTQPNELSIYNIFDTIGFSVTKRIVLR